MFLTDIVVIYITLCKKKKRFKKKFITAIYCYLESEEDFLFTKNIVFGQKDKKAEESVIPTQNSFVGE